jgi:hypothetical protein
MARVSQSTPNFGEASQRFIDAHIPAAALLPIVPPDAQISKFGSLDANVLGKSPGRYNNRWQDWRGLGGNYVSEGVTSGSEQIEFAGWPTTSVGVLGRYLPGIDSDAENEDARRLIEETVIQVFGRDADIAERLRGKSPRRLYAFEARFPDDPNRWVRTRRVVYEYAGAQHQLDLQGYGSQYLIAGTHQNLRDEYVWREGFDLAELYGDDRIYQVEDADFLRFLDTFVKNLERAGGKVLSSRGGDAPGLLRQYHDHEPIMPPRELLRALDRLPNTEETFPTRDDAVGVLSSVRAALGFEAEEYTDDVRDWFMAEGWCPDADYFDKIWDSLEQGVRVGRMSIDRYFRNAGIHVTAKLDFPDDGAEEMKAHREAKAEKKAEVEAEAKGLLADLANTFIFGIVNTRQDQGKFAMRRAFTPGVEWTCEDWWKLKALDPDVDLVEAAQDCDRYAGAGGLFVMLRDLNRVHPEVFYHGETRHPDYERGDIVPEPQQDGGTINYVNMRFQSPVIRYANRPPADPRQARADLEVYLEFVGRVFGELAAYELDTLAYMVQTRRRPGHLLFLVGDQGVGKSIYLNSLVSMFDGIGKDMGGQIDGTKLTSDAARRFALARVEGCRIISVKELPDGSTPAQMANITAALKQIVDAGPDADYFQIEQKGKDSRSVQNFARVVISSNYKTAIPLEEQDRRTFYVACGITLDNQPDADYYARLAEVTTNPERLATVYRFLKDRKIGHYDPTKAPPVSRDKLAATVAAIQDPTIRHMTAALETMRYHGRKVFDAQELADLMTAMGDNEFENTGHDDRRKYDVTERSSGLLQAMKRLQRHAAPIGKFKTGDGKSRMPVIYGFNRSRDAWTDVEGRKSALLDMLDEERERVRFTQEHPFENFRGPTKPRTT